jgi:hypothetical protein
MHVHDRSSVHKGRGEDATKLLFHGTGKVFAGKRAALFERTDASLVDAKADSVREAIGGNEAGKKSLEWNCSDEGITTKPACAG